MRTIGLDFGTHQTKICIRESIDKRNFSFEFFEFRDLHGELSYMLPSVVQINEDDTLSYGFVDETQAKMDCMFIPEECPQFDMVEPDKPVIPNKPIPYTHDDIIKKFPDFDRLNENYRNLIESYYDKINNMMRNIYNNTKEKLENNYKSLLSDYNRQKTKYEKDIYQWNLKFRETRKCIFRYFKQASLSRYEWPYIVDSDKVCVLYLAYIIFLLEEKYDNEFQLQTGIPTGYEDAEIKRNKAYTLIINAFKLVEDIFDGDFNKFRKAKFHELIELIQISDCTREDAQKYELKVFPEAYANLFPIANNNRIEPYISLIVDIGGGTTDISLFIIKELVEGEQKIVYPEIFAFHSVPKGLNYIMENSLKDKVEKYNRKLTIDSPLIDQDILKDVVMKYRREILGFVDKSLANMSMKLKDKGYDHKKFYKQLVPYLLLYSGGGYTKLLDLNFPYFTDAHIIGFDYFQKDTFIKNLSNVKNYGQILSTAFGLAHDQKTDEIKLSSIDVLFEHLTEKKPQSDKDYSLADIG